MSDRQIRFVTLGEVVLDQLQFGSEKTLDDVLGGSGTYCMHPFPGYLVFNCLCNCPDTFYLKLPLVLDCICYHLNRNY